LAPEGFGDLERWTKVAEELAAKAPPGEPWFNVYLGLAYHRAGRFKEALKHLQTQTDWGMSWPVLAMSYHRLGKDAEARRWLKKADDWYESTMRAALPGDIQGPTVLGYIWDRPQFLLLHREAKALIEGSAAPDPWLHLWQGRVYARLGHQEEADACFQKAVTARPDAPEIWLARSRIFTQLDSKDRAHADYAKALELKSADARPWIDQGRFLAERGEHKKADACFAKAAALTPDELNRFIEAGWWVVGPYPQNLKTPCPPEKEADPSKAVGAADGAGELRWQSMPTGQYGAVDIRACSNAGQGSAYALTYVFSPDERTVLLRVGAIGGVRLWLNGQLVHQNPDSNTWPISVPRVPVTLRAGRNTLLAKVSPKGNTPSLAVRLGDNPVDRGLTLLAVGLWEEAYSWFAKAFEREQQHDTITLYYLALLLFKGEREAYGRLCAQTLKPGSGWDCAMGCVLAPEGCPDAAQVLRIAERWAAELPDWSRMALVMALYRAGRFEEAIQAIHKAKFDTTFWSPVLAMAYHRLGKKEEAQRWLAVADARHLEVTTRYIEEGVYFYLFHREAKTLIEGVAPKDDAVKALLARAREQFNKLDKATQAYDIALLWEPDQPRPWLARGRRLADLKQWEKADADLARAIHLKPDDPQAWRERARVSTGLGKADQAAEFLAKARDLEETGQKK
jgi:tetratricopeptide (TPR) repeat protein